ncbi:OLC1v1013299C1 [Oldenlandia corymbosa var. corymbosa]|uniref:OLC1v1013299C1 n=1 Tax=Oldenlandia corymbosa var. corymbosa TaxID=529605 RepID=A0AAV1DYP7_OLDCO|nr:OLC1v1013299C1 [Oldenlandia corymbosa var. corymbosa]
MKNFIASMALLEWQKQSFFNFPLIFVFISVLAIILLNLFFSFRKKNNNKSRTKLPPSPPKLPLIVVVSSPRLAKEVLRTNDHAIANRPQIFSAKHLFYDCTDMVFSPLGNYWRNIRRICILELLSPKRVQSFSFVREEEVGKLVRRVAESRRGTTNLTNALALYVNNLVCRVAFGRDFSEGGDHIKHNFKKLLEEYQILLGGFSIGDFFPSLEFLHKFTGMESRLKNTFRRFDLFFDEILKDHQNPEGSKDQKDLVDVLLEVQQKEDAENHLTTNNIKAIILVILGFN